MDDVYKINAELGSYNADLTDRPQVIAANKTDAIIPEDDPDAPGPIERLRLEFEPQGVRVFPISAVTGQGLNELLFYVRDLLDTLPDEPVTYEQEFFPDLEMREDTLPYTVERSGDDPHVFIVEGPKIEKMLGYTNLESEKGFTFFQKFLKQTGILKQLEELGIQDGDTVRMYGLAFDYYKS